MTTENADMKIAELLKKAGFPTNYVVMDFESYYDSDYTLTKMTEWEYVTDKRFECLGVGLYHVMTSESIHVKEYIPPDRVATALAALQKRWGQNLEGVTVTMQNACFDALVCSERCGFYPKYIVDTKHLAAYLDPEGSHRLADLAVKLGLQPKGRTEDFKGLHWDDMSVDKKRALREYGKNDVDLQQAVFQRLLPQIKPIEIELAIGNRTTRNYVRPRLVLNKTLANDLLPQMRQTLIGMVMKTGFTAVAISGSKSIITLFNKVLPDGEQLPMKEGKLKKDGTTNMIPALAKDDDGCKELLVHPKKEVRELMEARLSIKSWPGHMKRIKSMLKYAECAKGLLPVPMAYYGAHTGRSQGNGGINLNNLGGSGRGGASIHPLIQKMRGLLMAPMGYTLGMVDSAQIECRVLAWLANDVKLVRGFANNEDIYSALATVLFQELVRKPKKDDPEPLAKLLEVRRGFGKDAILGGGYGMGPKKFFSRCLANPALRPYFDSGEYTFEFVERLILTYRAEHKEIVEFWRTIEKLFIFVTRYPSEVVEYKIGNRRLLKLWNEKGKVCVQLPSTRVLFYPHASVTCDGKLGYEHGKLWGGTLTENIVQAIARDLLMWWIVKLENSGLLSVHDVYDEIIALLLMDKSDELLKFMEDTMKTVPAWGAGLPMGAEGKLSVVYKK